MSNKAKLLAIANFNLFLNTNEKVEFSMSKDERVQAQYSGYDKAKGYDIRGIRAKSAAGKGFIRLSFATIDGLGARAYFNGALFKNDKKTTEKQPDFQGSLNLDNKTDGPKLRLAAWKKVGEKAGDYLSIAVQEYQAKGDGGSDAPAPGAFDLDDAPAPAKSAAKPAPAAPAKTGAAPAQSFDDFDDDIPFCESCFDSSRTASSKPRKMDRYSR